MDSIIMTILSSVLVAHGFAHEIAHKKTSPGHQNRASGGGGGYLKSRIRTEDLRWLYFADLMWIICKRARKGKLGRGVDTAN